MPTITADMNEFQRRNTSLLSKVTLEMLQANDWSRTPARLMRCVQCGERRITTPIMAWYRWDPSNFKCYKCQNKAE